MPDTFSATLAAPAETAAGRHPPRLAQVGQRFAEEARRIHYGETGERPIRGQATREQTEQLLEEGIAVLPLPMPAVLKETLQ